MRHDRDDRRETARPVRPEKLSPGRSKLHSALRSSGTSPNFRISLASLKSPLDGSPVRENATAPAWPGFRDSASARMTAALALRHSVASPAATPLSEKTKRVERRNRSSRAGIHSSLSMGGDNSSNNTRCSDRQNFFKPAI